MAKSLVILPEAEQDITQAYRVVFLMVGRSPKSNSSTIVKAAIALLAISLDLIFSRY